MNQSSNPNASVVFLNWYLSHLSQAIWQKVMNQRLAEPSKLNENFRPMMFFRKRDSLEGRQDRMVGYLDRKLVGKFYKHLDSQADVESK